MNDADLDKWIDNLSSEEMNEELNSLLENRNKPSKLAKQIAELIRSEGYVDEDGNTDYKAFEVIGDSINELFGNRTDYPSTYIKWIADRATYKPVNEILIPRLEKIYDIIGNKNIDYNDADDWVRRLEPNVRHKKDNRRILLFTTQSTHYLVILGGIGRDNTIHIRRVWKDHHTDDGEPTRRMLLYGDYTDNFDEIKYVSRPNLQWYIDKNFEIEYNAPTNKKLENHPTKSYRTYGDARDNGYVLSKSMLSSISKRIENVYGSIHDIDYMFLLTSSALSFLKEQGYINE